jgi:hypothetical protein
MPGGTECWTAHDTQTHAFASMGLALGHAEWRELLEHLSGVPSGETVVTSPEVAGRYAELRVASNHPEAGTGNRAEVTNAQFNSVEIEAALNSPGWVVLNRLPYPGWRLQVVDRLGRRSPGRLERINGVMWGVFLPAGQYQLVYEYRPRGWFVAMAVSLGAASLICGVLLVQGRNRRHRLRFGASARGV